MENDATVSERQLFNSEMSSFQTILSKNLIPLLRNLQAPYVRHHQHMQQLRDHHHIKLAVSLLTISLPNFTCCFYLLD